MFEEVVIDGDVVAIIVRKDFQKQGIHFFTPNDYSQQLAYMSHQTGKEIQPHVHKKYREMFSTHKKLY